MIKTSTIATMVLLWACIVIGIAPVTAAYEENACIVPPDNYFVKDSVEFNGIPAHDEGLQAGYTFWLTEANANQISGIYLYDLKHFKLRQSHNDQIKISMGKAFYCYSMPDYPYTPDVVIGNDGRNQEYKETYISPADNHAGNV